jgi:hypothetical protein
MNRKEFDSHFGMMCKALAVKVNKWQGELYWDEFKHAHAKDFEEACKFCGRGTAGHLPFQSKFGDSVTAAMEMRIAAAKDKHNQEANNTWSGKLPQSDPMEFLLGSACMMNIKDRICGRNLGKALEVEKKIRAVLADEEFKNHKFPYVMTDPAHPRPQDWLAFQLEEDPPWYAAARAGKNPVGPLQLEHVPAWED